MESRAGENVSLAGQAVKVEQSTSSNTMIGVGSALVEILDGGNSVEQQRFLTSNLSDDALREMSAVDRALLLRRARNQSGGVEVVNMTVVAKGPVEIQVKSRKNGHRAKIYVFGAKRQPGKIREFG